MARLAGGTATEGRLEMITAGGGWGTVCDDFFGVTEAKVACRQMGLPWTEATTVSKVVRPGVLAFVMDNVECDGTESSLQACTYKRSNNCEADEAVSVICAGSSADNVLGATVALGGSSGADAGSGNDAGADAGTDTNTNTNAMVGGLAAVAGIALLAAVAAAVVLVRARRGSQAIAPSPAVGAGSDDEYAAPDAGAVAGKKQAPPAHIAMAVSQPSSSFSIPSYTPTPSDSRAQLPHPSALGPMARGDGGNKDSEGDGKGTEL
jgi:hypothetical protein